ncbi:hypothetical protein Ahy_B03g063443 [Arachis hypogaea]|uniref:Aminotransferase-like plant mobile domain-containing protein n=1 Tax=Arachis hypogaea TaxID=3818 RepID=A0A444ZX94_ARAHY|nr:hypothetical protein Ahy_B03g063443 [Arachis hypogaea]
MNKCHHKFEPNWFELRTIGLYKEFESSKFEPLLIFHTPSNPRENDPDSIREIVEPKTQLMEDDPARLYRLDGVAHIAGVINDEPQRCIRSMRRQQGMPLDECYMFAVNCSWFQETFGECPEGADEETVRHFARAYIMMLLGTQLFADKSGNRIHIRWLPYVARLEEMGSYSWGSAALPWLYRCMCRVANRHVVKLAGPLQLLERRARVGTRRSQREWRWLEQAIGEADEAGRVGGRGRGRRGRQRAPVAGHDDGDLRDVDGGGRGAVGVVTPHHGGLGGEGYATGDPTAHGEVGLGEGPLGDYFVGVPPDDHTLQQSTPWVSPGSTFSVFLAGVGFEGDFGGSPFLDEISAIMHDDEATCGRSQTTGTQAPLHVDLNELPSVPPPEYFALGGTPTSAHTVVGPSSFRPAHVQPGMPAQPAPQDEDEDDEIEDEEPLIRRGQRTRVPRRCFTGSHLFR